MICIIIYSIKPSLTVAKQVVGESKALEGKSVEEEEEAGHEAQGRPGGVALVRPDGPCGVGDWKQHGETIKNTHKWRISKARII
jgi:hypothetical protein